MKLQYDEPLSNIALNFNLRPSTEGLYVEVERLKIALAKEIPARAAERAGRVRAERALREMEIKTMTSSCRGDGGDNAGGFGETNIDGATTSTSTKRTDDANRTPTPDDTADLPTTSAREPHKLQPPKVDGALSSTTVFPLAPMVGR